MLTCFLNEPKFYGDTTPEIIQTARELIDTDPEFVAKAACYARNIFHMRSVSHALAAEVAKHASGDKCVRKMIRKVVERTSSLSHRLTDFTPKIFGERKQEMDLDHLIRTGKQTVVALIMFFIVLITVGVITK